MVKNRQIFTNLTGFVMKKNLKNLLKCVDLFHDKHGLYKISQLYTTNNKGPNYIYFKYESNNIKNHQLTGFQSRTPKNHHFHVSSTRNVTLT